MNDDDEYPVSFFLHLYEIYMCSPVSLSLLPVVTTVYDSVMDDSTERIPGEGRCRDLPTVAGRFLAWNSHDIQTERFYFFLHF